MRTIDLTEEFEDRDDDDQSTQSSIYLRNSNQDTSYVDSQISEEEDREKVDRRVRFQYDGILKPSLVISNDAAGTCTASLYKPGIPTMASCDSFHVLESGRRYDYRLKLEYDIIPGVVQTCDIVDDDLEIRMTNGLGLIAGDKRLWAEYHSLSDDAFEELSRCDQPSGGCLLT